MGRRFFLLLVQLFSILSVFYFGLMMMFNDESMVLLLGSFVVMK